MTSRRSGKSRASCYNGGAKGPFYWCDSHGDYHKNWDYVEDSLVYSDEDDIYHSDFEDDMQFAKEASRSKGKWTASIGSSSGDTYRRREGHGSRRHAYEDEGEDDYYTGRSSHYQSHSSRHPSYHDSEDYPTSRRTRRPDDHLPPDEHRRDSRRQHDPPSTSHRRHSRRTNSPSGERSRVPLSPYGENFTSLQDLPDLEDLPDLDDGGIDCCYDRSCTVCSHRFVSDEPDEGAPPPPPYSRYPTSGGPSGGSGARKEVRWADEEEEAELIVDDY
ncbi:hypothetical protein HOY82DRAFT_622423 [Tuber indicum]|nr:hypothetical protein HOY82DRAFT_622423 [Tuber indicum]